jgi:hypothetical protein
MRSVALRGLKTPVTRNWNGIDTIFRDASAACSTNSSPETWMEMETLTSSERGETVRHSMAFSG